MGFILAATRFGDISHIAGTSDLGDIRTARPDAAKLRTDGDPTICLVELINRKFANLLQIEDVAIAWFGNQEIAMPKFYIDFNTTRRSPRLPRRGFA